MLVLSFLIPTSLLLGLLGLAGFVWAVRRGQFDDPEGERWRVLSDDWDDRPKPGAARAQGVDAAARPE